MRFERIAQKIKRKWWKELQEKSKTGILEL